MKAKTFIEALFAIYSEIFAGGLEKPMTEQINLMQTGSILFTTRFEKLHKFYSQPFTPPLITELFENVNLSTIPEWIQFKDELGIKRKEINFNSPTLDTFISDCNRAGIELTFKPEIAEKIK